MLNTMEVYRGLNVDYLLRDILSHSLGHVSQKKIVQR